MTSSPIGNRRPAKPCNLPREQARGASPPPGRDRCEYCRVPQAAFRRSFHIEHVIARQHGGLAEADNLALACWHCNLKKGPNLTGIDPDTGQITALFNPRKDRWLHHFTLRVETLLAEGIEIQGLTPVGRATVRVLGMNEDMRQMLRYQLWREYGGET